MIKSTELIDTVLAELGISRTELCRRRGWNKSQIEKRMQRDAVKADDFLELMEYLGVEVVLRYQSKEIKPYVKGFGRRVRAMSNNVLYDTENANALSNNFYADGMNKYPDGSALELYVDDEGRYFFVEYFSDETKRPRLFSVNGALAAAFVEKYGTEIDKSPK